MSYDAVERRLGRPPESASVTALPDGSVDTYYAVRGPGGRPLDSAAEFGRQVAESASDSFPLTRTARQPGGQAVNAARQAHALGDDVTLFGHLDDAAFDALDCRTRSMGAPAEMSVLEFDEEEVLLAAESEDVENWNLRDFEAVADDPEAALSADAVCCGNWRSVAGMSETLRRLGRGSPSGSQRWLDKPDGGPFVLDPGKLVTAERDRVRGLFDALGALDERYDAVLSVDEAELRYAAESLDCDDDGLEERLAALREAGAATAVLHGESVAAAVTRRRVARVPNLSVRESVGHTGAGDRFGAALAHGLARGWEWESALALGNLAASHYVETGDTGDRAALREFSRTHEAKS